MAQIRPAEIRDAQGLAQVHVQSWIDTYTGIMPTAVLDNLSVEKKTETWAAALARLDNPTTTLVAVDSRGNLVGFITVGPAREAEYFGVGEVYALYLDKHYHGKGIGAALFFEGMKELKNLGYHSAFAVTLTASPFRFFYERVGGAVHGHMKKTFGGEELDSTVYYWPEIPEVRPKFKKIMPEHIRENEL